MFTYWKQWIDPVMFGTLLLVAVFVGVWLIMLARRRTPTAVPELEPGPEPVIELKKQQIVVRPLTPSSVCIIDLTAQASELPRLGDAELYEIVGPTLGEYQRNQYLVSEEGSLHRMVGVDMELRSAGTISDEHIYLKSRSDFAFKLDQWQWVESEVTGRGRWQFFTYRRDVAEVSSNGPPPEIAKAHATRRAPRRTFV